MSTLARTYIERQMSQNKNNNPYKARASVIFHTRNSPVNVRL